MRPGSDLRNGMLLYLNHVSVKPGSLQSGPIDTIWRQQSGLSQSIDHHNATPSVTD